MLWLTLLCIVFVSLSLWLSLSGFEELHRENVKQFVANKMLEFKALKIKAMDTDATTICLAMQWMCCRNGWR